LVLRPTGQPIAVFVTVTNAQTGEQVERAIVEMGGQTARGPNFQDRWMFRLPTAGPYRYRVSADGFEESGGTAVATDATIAPPTTVDVRLQPHVRRETVPVTLMITDVETNDAIEDARVEVAGGTELTGNTGCVTLSLPPGNHGYRVSADGYDTGTGTIEITGEGAANLMIQLQRILGTEEEEEEEESGDVAPREPPRDRTEEALLQFSRDYREFQAQVLAWIRRLVAARRAEPLVAASNLRELHATVMERLSPDPDQSASIELAAHLRAGRWRYESVEFSLRRLTTVEIGEPEIR
jgi:hypothetical protein